MDAKTKALIALLEKKSGKKVQLVESPNYHILNYFNKSGLKGEVDIVDDKGEYYKVKYKPVGQFLKLDELADLYNKLRQHFKEVLLQGGGAEYYFYIRAL